MLIKIKCNHQIDQVGLTALTQMHCSHRAGDDCDDNRDFEGNGDFDDNGDFERSDFLIFV